MGTLGSTCLVISMYEIPSHPWSLLFQMLCLIPLSKAAHSMWSVDVTPGNESITVELWKKRFGRSGERKQLKARALEVGSEFNTDLAAEPLRAPAWPSSSFSGSRNTYGGGWTALMCSVHHCSCSFLLPNPRVGPWKIFSRLSPQEIVPVFTQRPAVALLGLSNPASHTCIYFSMFASLMIWK